mgnify:FL=1
MIYVIDSYEQHFPVREMFPYRPMPWFWRLVHVAFDLGFIRVEKEGDYFKHGTWTWRPWEPRVVLVNGKYLEICPSLRERLTSAWYDLKDEVRF